MKSNKVRMEVNRNHHEWFKSQMGNTNNERMGAIRRKLQLMHGMSQSVTFWQDNYDKESKENKILKRLLGLSIMVSIISVGYLAYVQGWFL